MRLKKARGKKWKGFDRLDAKVSATIRSLYKITFIEVVPRFNCGSIKYFGDEIKFKNESPYKSFKNVGIQVPNEFKPLINVTP